MSALGTRAATTVSMNDQQMPDNYLPVLSISPSVLTFGVVSSGFYYNLKFEVKNHETTPVRIKVFVNPLEGEKNNIRVVNLPDIIAPGMVAQIIIELMAEWPGISIFNLKIIQNYDETVYSKLIEANIVTQETFKYVKKSLELQKRPIHEHNVTNLSSIVGFYNETASIATPATTFSEALIMDDEDLEDLLEYPTCSNVYWDPFEKCLRIDPLLGKVIASQDITLEESQTRTAEARYYLIFFFFYSLFLFSFSFFFFFLSLLLFRRKRNQELEEQGFLTKDTFDRLKNERMFGSPKQLANTGEYNSRPATSAESLNGEEAEGSEGVDAFNESRVSLTNDSHASTTSKALSVASLLAMKRDKIEKQRRMTVTASMDFSKLSKKDSMVNSMRTLSMIQNKMNQAAVLPPITHSLE
jgi:hypothetical protein